MMHSSVQAEEANSLLSLAWQQLQFLSTHTISLYSFWVIWPCVLYACFYYFTLVRSSLFICSGLLTSLLDFLLIGIDSSWAVKRHLWKSTSCAEPLIFLRLYVHEEYSWNLLSWSTEWWCFFPFVLCFEDPEFHHFMATAAKATPSLHISKYSLFMRFGRASPLTGFLITYVRKFPSTLSRDLLDCLCPAVLTFHLTKEWLKLPQEPQEPGPESKRLPPAVWKSPYLLDPIWEVCDRCCNNGITHLAHQQSQGRVPCVLSALSHKVHLALSTILSCPS